MSNVLSRISGTNPRRSSVQYFTVSDSPVLLLAYLFNKPDFLQDLLRDVNQAFPKEAMETFIEMQCGISGPFGTGGSMFAGANHFDQQISSVKMDSLGSTPDLIPTSLQGINLPPELQLICLTLDKVALASCCNMPEEQNANLPEKMEPMQLPQSSKRVRMPLCGFDSSPFNATIPMDISMDFCHGWWGDDSNESENTADSGSTGKNKGSAGEHVESHGPSTSRSRASIPSKSSGVKRPRKPSAKKCDTIMDDEDSGNEASEDANIPSINIVIDADQEDSDDNDHNAKGKRPNTHKKRQVPRSREEIPSGSSTSKSGKGSRKRKYYSPRSGNFRNQASPRSSPRTARNSKESKRVTGNNRQ